MKNYKRIIIFVLLYAVVLFLLSLCWVGAEWVFENAVHTSKVDGCVAILLSYYIALRITPYPLKRGRGNG